MFGYLIKQLKTFESHKQIWGIAEVKCSGKQDNNLLAWLNSFFHWYSIAFKNGRRYHDCLVPKIIPLKNSLIGESTYYSIEGLFDTLINDHGDWGTLTFFRPKMGFGINWLGRWALPLKMFQWDFPKEVWAVFRTLIWEEPLKKVYYFPCVLKNIHIFNKSLIVLTELIFVIMSISA